MDWIDRRILITGGTAGIGYALAHALGARGARVMICGRDPGRLDGALSRLPGAVGAVCDVGQASRLPGLMDEVAGQLGGLDMLVNNAGIQLAWDMAADAGSPEAVAERTARELSIDLTAPILLSHLALPLLLQGRSPTVVNVTSVLARHPRPTAPVYCAAKAGLRSFTRSLRAQLAPQGVRVVELVPPLVATGMTRGRGQATMPASELAQAALCGLDAGRTEVCVGKARMAAWLDRLAPSVLASMMARQ